MFRPFRPLPGVLERIKVAFGSRHPGNLGLRQIYLGDDAFVAQMKSRVDAADTLVDVPRQQRLPAPRPLATTR